jgi:uncharacterized membrane protein YdbT with pleckstrin-like domain
MVTSPGGRCQSGMDPEKPLWVGHASHWRYFGWWLFAVLLLAATVALLVTSTSKPGWYSLVPAGVALIVVVGIFIARARLTYKISSTKVIVEEGLVMKDSDELRLKDIRSIAVQRRGVRGWFGVGDIEFSSAARDDADIAFRAVPRVTAVRDLVRVQQEEHDRGEPTRPDAA